MQSLIRILLSVFGIVLITDAVWLLAQNKIHLGILLPLFIGIIFVVHAYYWQSIHRYLTTRKALKRIWSICWGLFALWLLSVCLFFFYIHNNKTSQNTAQPFEAIIVLGSGLIQGQPSPTLKLRLDQAAEVYQNSPQALVVVTGGLGHGQKVTEASVMAQYLKEHFNIQHIAEENQSTSTALNLKNSQAILQQHGMNTQAPIALITSDFHTLRAEAIARHQGYSNITSYGANTPLETRYNAWLREYFAYISGWVLNEY